MLDEGLIKKFGTLFSYGNNESSIELAYLFGSHASGTEGPITNHARRTWFDEALSKRALS